MIDHKKESQHRSNKMDNESNEDDDDDDQYIDDDGDDDDDDDDEDGHPQVHSCQTHWECLLLLLFNKTIYYIIEKKRINDDFHVFVDCLN